jgi:hypothetical protein
MKILLADFQFSHAERRTDRRGVIVNFRCKRIKKSTIFFSVLLLKVSSIITETALAFLSFKTVLLL